MMQFEQLHQWNEVRCEECGHRLGDFGGFMADQNGRVSFRTEEAKWKTLCIRCANRDFRARGYDRKVN